MHRLVLFLLSLCIGVTANAGGGTRELAEAIEDVLFVSSVGVIGDRLVIQHEATANDNRSEPFPIEAAVGTIDLDCDVLDIGTLTCPNVLTAGFTYRVCLYLPDANLIGGINLPRDVNDASRCINYVAQ